MPEMAPQDPACEGGGSGFAPRLAWERPSLIRLPRLTELTLATGGIPGGGDTGSGSTVVP
jgi:hypothetical protein